MVAVAEVHTGSRTVMSGKTKVTINKAGMAALQAETTHKIDAATQRGLHLSNGQPLDARVEVVTAELRAIGVHVDPALVRVQLVAAESGPTRRSEPTPMATIPFIVTWVRGQMYRLRNVTDETIDMIMMTVDHPAGLARDLPDNATLGPGESWEFMIIGTFQTGTPSQVKVSWDVHPTPFAIPLPPHP